MSLCLNCKKTRGSNPCLGQFSDGHYTWFTPVTENQMKELPSWVWNSEVYSVQSCSIHVPITAE